jgi:hypothetical protein
MVSFSFVGHSPMFDKEIGELMTIHARRPWINKQINIYAGPRQGFRQPQSTLMVELLNIA